MRTTQVAKINPQRWAVSWDIDPHPMDEARPVEGPDETRLSQAVGRVAMSSASLEAALRMLFYRLMSSDIALLVCDGETPEWLISNCERIMREEHQHDSARTATRNEQVIELQQCRSLFGLRNAVIHATWTVSTDGTFLAMRTKKHDGLRLFGFTSEDLAEIAEAFDEQADVIDSLARYED